LEFGPLVDQTYFDAEVDGVRELLALTPNQAHQTYPWPHPLDGSLHHLTLSKRNEAASGYATFDGLRIDPKGKVNTPVAHHYRLKFIFFGDSITAGACNEDGPNDQWDSRRTHNANKSYAAFTAQALDADWENISVSGMGIVTGYVPFVASRIWDRLYPKADSPRADLASWKPDVVFVNYGENDTSFTQRHGQPFPAAFAKDYVSYVEGLRSAYPKAEIVLLRGGMSGGAENPDLRAAWTQAVGQLEKADSRIAHFVFNHFTAQHPRVPDDQAMANELVPWLKEQGFVKSYLQ
jgi:lysophospholipase L1-like esterase